MKNVLKVLLLLFVTGLVLSSCNAALSLTKARTAKKYLVQQPLKKHQRTTALQINQLAWAQSAPSTSQKHGQKEITEDPIATKANIEKDAAAQSPGFNPENISSSLFPLQYLKSPLNTLQTITGSRGASQEAFGLLSVLVVVLLGSYVAGLLLDKSGLGWLIHILLLGSLVAMILWMLQVG